MRMSRNFILAISLRQGQILKIPYKMLIDDIRKLVCITRLRKLYLPLDEAIAGGRAEMLLEQAK